MPLGRPGTARRRNRRRRGTDERLDAIFRRDVNLQTVRCNAALSRIRLCSRLVAELVDVDHADADLLWRVTWNKPLFANAREGVAKRWCAFHEERLCSEALP